MLESISPRQELLYVTIARMGIAVEKELILVLIALRFLMPVFTKLQVTTSFTNG
jgi:hypothetical protein